MNSILKYRVHYDEDNKTYWIGYVVRSADNSPLFVQQIGNDYQYKKVAQRVADRYNKN